jgi:tRNA U34 2-thiouridine synthase MnmA/TrmU
MQYVETVQMQRKLAPPRLDEDGRQVTAVLMYSGGLDSTLAALVLLVQGIDVRAVNMHTGFCTTMHRRDLGRTHRDGQPVRHEAIAGAGALEIPIDLIDVREGYLDIVTQPKHGWGAAVNPCLDCRVFMFRHADRHRREIGAHFIATGEVVGQRPMSQLRKKLRLIEEEAGLERMIVRPLSAKRLWETIPEERGWVDREQLLDFTGRGRKGQMQLARDLGLVSYPQPAGGCCFLTDHNYAVRLKDAIEHEGAESIDFDDILVLKVGRQFRLPDGNKAVVGRDQAENEHLERRYAHLGVLLTAPDLAGPTTLYMGDVDSSDFELAARITARYSKRGGSDSACIEARGEAGPTLRTLRVTALPEGEERAWLLA